MCSGVTLMSGSNTEDTNEGLCIRCGDEIWDDADTCSACLYDDEIEHQVERTIERMHGVDN